MPLPLVAIVGRPNVGKSTLFNRLVGERIALVAAEPGVTRDRQYRAAEWAGRRFTLVDTGGLMEGAGGLEELVGEQARRAIAQAAVIIFVVDARVGLTPADKDIADMLRRTQKPVVVAINKVDDFKHAWPTGEFFQLGLGEPVCISAEAGLNIGDLLDAVAARLPQDGTEENTEPVRIAIIGRPNVGKSSLVNAILGEERVIVSDEPGTTRDAIDTEFHRNGRAYTLIDTAGIRRKARIATPLERYSVLRARRAVERCDVAILVLDALTGVTAQDRHLAGLVARAKKGLVIALNKCDLITDRIKKDYARIVPVAFTFVSFAPLLFISAATGEGVDAVLPTVDKVMEAFTRRIPAGSLNRIVMDAVLAVPPPGYRRKRGRVLRVTQVATKPPRIALFVNEPGAFPPAYLRYLENRLRQTYDLEGSPVELTVRREED